MPGKTGLHRFQVLDFRKNRFSYIIKRRITQTISNLGKDSL